MVHQLTHCPKHWRPRCYPHPCDTKPPVQQPPPTKPTNQPTNQPTTQPVPPGPVHNVVYLVDEHDITNESNPQNPTLNRKGATLRMRYAWHHQVANLNTMNAGEIPDTIQLHEQISDPRKNKNFSWEGFMFDIPGGQASCRVGIVAGAADASDASLTGQGGASKSQIDRVVGFAGTYVDNTVPIGPLVQVRRDDSYRRLGASLNTNPKLDWRCAYYITKDTPKQPSGGFTGSFTLVPEGSSLDPDHPAEGQGSAEHDTQETVAYDQLMDKNVGDEIPAVDGGESWGGMMFGFTTDALDAGNADAEPEAFGGSALDELKEDA